MVKSTSNEKGFSVIELVLVLVIVALVGVVGFLAYKDQAEKSTAHPASTSTTKQTTTTPAATAAPTTSANYLVIKEWGVEIKMADANKVQYNYTGKPGTNTNGSYDSSIELSIKPDYLQDKTCMLSVGMSRTTTLSSIAPSSYQNYKQVGSNFYFEDGSPYSCGNQADDTLDQAVLQEFTLANLQSL